VLDGIAVVAGLEDALHEDPREVHLVGVGAPPREPVADEARANRHARLNRFVD